MSASRFRRLWVLQEVPLGSSHSSRQCGQVRITYHDLRRAFVLLTERAGVPRELCDILSDKNDIVYGLTISNVLVTSRQHLRSGSRDKIYGIIGLLGPVLRKGIKPS